MTKPNRCVVQFGLGWLILGLATGLAVAESNGERDGQAESSGREVDQANVAVGRGVEWLLQQQGADGGWHSATYASMRGGSGITALVVYSLSHQPRPWSANLESRVDRGLRFLVSNLDEEGYVRAPDGSSDYPTYATALALIAMERMKLDKWQSERQRMRSYLQKAQKRDSAADPEFGGWGMTGGFAKSYLAKDPASVSATRFALEALQVSGGIDDATRQAALAFLQRCQNYGTGEPNDGGFYFTPLPKDPLNKAGWFEGSDKAARAHSYGTPTSEGVLGFMLCGVRERDSRLAAAIRWLQQNETVSEVPGFLPEGRHATDAEKSLKFYYYAALARAMRETPDSNWSMRRTALLKAISEQQQPDGSWTNSCPLMREDDPLVATSLAVTAILEVRGRK
jgi:hypothetical protein